MTCIIENTIDNLKKQLQKTECVDDRVFIGRTKHYRTTGGTVRIDRYSGGNVILQYSSKTIEASVNIYFLKKDAVAQIGGLLLTPIWNSEGLRFTFLDPFTASTTVLKLSDFIPFLEKLSSAKWPGTNDNVLLKEAHMKTKTLVSGNKLLLVEEPTNYVVSVLFSAPVGTLYMPDIYSAYLKLSSRKIKLNPYFMVFDDFSRNYLTAIALFKNIDLYEEFDILE